MSEQRRLFKVSKREATRRWQEARAVVGELERAEAVQAADLKATREALTTARKNQRDAESVLGELLDAEDPTIPGAIDAERTLPGEA